MAASGTVHGLRGEPQRTKSEQREIAKKEVWKNGVSMRLYGCGH